MLPPSASSLTALASLELEDLRSLPTHDGVPFPPACLRFLLSLPGNRYCMDCGKYSPEWASVTHGSLVCLQCSGTHRSYGVQTSFVRSIHMDTWSHQQIISMMEGGNGQLRSFFERHQMGMDDTRRYFKKAALFYRANLAIHASKVAQKGVYQGRERNRICRVEQSLPTPVSTDHTYPGCVCVT